MSEALAHSPREIQSRAARLVAAEVHCCLSSLVSTLARAYGGTDRHSDAGGELVALTEQAMELASPVLDYASAAREAGWSYQPRCWTRPDENADGGHMACSTAETACKIDDIEPHENEVYEHWAVSSWLADKLEAKGEKVDRDFAGLIVWARTTTGQAISLDGSIEAITIETGYASGADA